MYQQADLEALLGVHIQAIETLNVETLDDQERLQFFVSGRVLAVQVPAPDSGIEALLLVRHDDRSSTPTTDEYLNPAYLKILAVNGAPLVATETPRQHVPRLRRRLAAGNAAYGAFGRGAGARDIARTR